MNKNRLNQKEFFDANIRLTDTSFFRKVGLAGHIQKINAFGQNRGDKSSLSPENKVLLKTQKSMISAFILSIKKENALFEWKRVFNNLTNK